MSTLNSISATEFKAKCLAIMDKVASTGQSITITKRGKPIAKITPTDTKKAASPFGLMKNHCKTLVDDNELLEPVLPDDAWNVLK